MTDRTDRLSDLLPSVYRIRDARFGGQLAALLRVINEQVDIVERDIDALYENWFIETAKDWLVPYIAELVGYTPIAIPSFSQPTGADQEGGLRAAYPRREVARTIANRRRKGTLALLEELARDTAEWPARAVEFYRLLLIAQSTNHPQLARGQTLALRNGEALDLIQGPFDSAAHTAIVTRINSRRRRGRFNIPNVGLFVWRLRPYSITKAPAYCIDRERNHYTFSALGNDTPLITKTVVEPSPTHIADELNVPGWIRARAFDDRTADYYGREKSLLIWQDAENPVPIANIVATDLSNWAYHPKRNQVAVDPVRGRIAFSSRNAPETGVWVSYHYGFSADVGGGEYHRWISPTDGRPVYKVGKGSAHSQIMDAFRHWQTDKEHDFSRRNAIIEIVDSGTYQESIDLTLENGDLLELRAGPEARPVIRLLDWSSNRPDAFRVRGLGLTAEDVEVSTEDATPAPDNTVERPLGRPQLVLDGLLITGRGVWVSGEVGCVVIRHTTLVPGWSLEHNCEPHSHEPSLELQRTPATIDIRHSIVGGIRVLADEVNADPITIAVRDSILDATSREARAISDPDGRRAHAILTVMRSTVRGVVAVHAIKLGENSIFDGTVSVGRRQIGCLRFSFVPVESRTPRRYHCQPDLVRTAVADAFKRGELSSLERELALLRETLRVYPSFNSVRYGTPHYLQLGETCAPEIGRGADDESEMGVFHDLFQPQRTANLQGRLDEYVPAGVSASVMIVT